MLTMRRRYHLQVWTRASEVLGRSATIGLVDAKSFEGSWGREEELRKREARDHGL